MACLAQIDQAKMAAADCGVGGYWKDPNYQRGTCVNSLRDALRSWAKEVSSYTLNQPTLGIGPEFIWHLLGPMGAYTSCLYKQVIKSGISNYIWGMKKKDADLSTAIQNCARLEQNLIAVQNCGIDPDTFQCTQDQIASLLGAAESIMAVEEMHSFMAERNRAALDASHLLFGTKGVIKAPDVYVSCVLPQQRRVGNQAGGCEKPVFMKAMSDGWQPRWPGDMGDHFEPYTQLVEQYLHSAVFYHAKALEQLSGAFVLVKRASKQAKDVAYIHTLAAAAGLSVKEYQRLLEMFNRIDKDKIGTISKQQLMAAMKRDKDIAAFMQLSRAKQKDGRRESFEGVFNRIDSEGLGAVTWEAFLHFFSSERSLMTDSVMNPMCVQPMCNQPLCVQASMCAPPNLYSSGGICKLG